MPRHRFPDIPEKGEYATADILRWEVDVHTAGGGAVCILATMLEMAEKTYSQAHSASIPHINCHGTASCSDQL